MAITVTLRVGVGTVNLKWAGNSGPVTVYRLDTIDGEYEEKTDWTAEETLGALVTTGEMTDDSPLEFNAYYITDGTNWGTASITPANFAPLLDTNYQTASISKASSDDAFRAAINNGGSVKFNPIPIEYESGNNGLAIVAVVGSPVALDELNFGVVFADLGCKFNILQTGTIQNFAGYEAKLSGATKIQYTAKTVS